MKIVYGSEVGESDPVERELFVWVNSVEEYTRERNVSGKEGLDQTRRKYLKLRRMSTIFPWSPPWEGICAFSNIPYHKLTHHIVL